VTTKHTGVRFLAGSAILVAMAMSLAHAGGPLLPAASCKIGATMHGVIAGTLDELNCSITGGPGGVIFDPNNGSRYKTTTLACLDNVNRAPCDPYICCVAGTGYFASVRLIAPTKCFEVFRCVGICCDSNGAVIDFIPPPPGCSLSIQQTVLICKNS
jgi:hypothetical protein